MILGPDGMDPSNIKTLCIFSSADILDIVSSGDIRVHSQGTIDSEVCSQDLAQLQWHLQRIVVMSTFS